MPEKVDKLKVSELGIEDKRRKISEALKEEIKDRYAAGQSQRKISRDTGVSRRMVKFILFPEEYEKHLEDRRKRKVWKKYYDKDKHREAIKDLRQRKKEALKNDNRGITQDSSSANKQV